MNQPQTFINNAEVARRGQSKRRACGARKGDCIVCLRPAEIKLMGLPLCWACYGDNDQEMGGE